MLTWSCTFLMQANSVAAFPQCRAWHTSVTKHRIREREKMKERERERGEIEKERMREKKRRERGREREMGWE